jgi:mitochondrial fission protein ELM1
LNPADPASLVLWRFTDGRRGHDAQSRGLALALARLRPARICDIPAAGPARSALEFIRRRCDAGAAEPDPHLLIGAGHGTHLPLLAARRARGGKIVLLMRPSLPAACFDLCLIPEHDGAEEHGNVVLTRGPLNTIRRAPPGPGDRGLILVGGLSRHYRWDETALLGQIRGALAASGSWTIADSPRTPAPTRRQLREIPGARYLPWESGPDALAEALSGAARAWVSADSLSMIFEALTAGAAVGVLELPPAASRDRVVEALRRLRAERWVTSFSDWQPGSELPAPPAPLAEAARCAELVLRRLC